MRVGGGRGHLLLALVSPAMHLHHRLADVLSHCVQDRDALDDVDQEAAGHSTLSKLGDARREEFCWPDPVPEWSTEMPLRDPQPTPAMNFEMAASIIVSYVSVPA